MATATPTPIKYIENLVADFFIPSTLLELLQERNLVGIWLSIVALPLAYRDRMNAQQLRELHLIHMHRIAKRFYHTGIHVIALN